jgi:hypothetical protein
LEFEVGNLVYLRVSPMKNMKRFEVKGKLAPCYIRPFPILEKYGTVAYKLDLPPSLAEVHDLILDGKEGEWSDMIFGASRW